MTRGDRRLFDRMRANLAAARQDPPIVAVTGSDPRPCSTLERSLWLLTQLHPDSRAYHECNAYRVRGPLQPNAFRDSLAAMARRHTILRTVYLRRGDDVQAQPTPALPTCQVEDHGGTAAHAIDAVIGARARALADLPFDIQHGPLLRVLLLRFAPDEWGLVVAVHHLVWDQPSLSLWFEELAAMDAERTTAVTPLPDHLQYGDYAAWQRACLAASDTDRLRRFWRQRLTDATTPVALPTDRPRPARPSGAGHTAWFTVDAATQRALDVCARNHGGTLFSVLLAGFATLLARLTEQHDLVLGIPATLRRRPELQRMLGPLTNTLPLRLDLSDEPTVAGAIERVTDELDRAYAHGELPFASIVEAVEPSRPSDRPPLVQVMFTLYRAPETGARLPGLHFTPVEVELGSARFDLEVHLWPTPAGLRGKFVADADLLDMATVELWHACYQRLLAAMAHAPQATITRLPLSTEDDEQRRPRQARTATPPLPQPAVLPTLFAAVARRCATAIAVVDGDLQITYGQVATSAADLERRLRQLGVGPEVMVGVAAAQSAHAVVGMLAVVLAGGAYVPLDPELPAHRLTTMAQLAHIGIVVGAAAHRSCFVELGLRYLAVDVRAAATPAPSAPPPAITPDSLAYAIFTSGSSGTPKGVLVPHRAVVRLVTATDYVHIAATDCIGQAAHLGFDATTFELWGALLNGARLVLVPRDVLLQPRALGVFLRQHGVSILFLSTAVFHAIADRQPDALATVRDVLVGGEVVDPRRVRRVLQDRAQGSLMVVYGPTENTTFSTWQRVDAVTDDTRPLPIGVPIANTQAVVVDRHLQAVPAGVPGELCLAGAGLARGYLGQSALTAASFVPNPFADIEGERLYRTGDRVRQRADGVLEFLGRLDRQVKVRGFRVELEEIEKVLAQHPQVQRVAVQRLPAADAAQEPGLAAFVVADPEHVPAVDDLRAFLRHRLPEYMLPASFVCLDALPLTHAGKIDARALEAVARTRHPTTSPGPQPSTALQRTLARVWREILWLDRDVGLDEDFFDLGGHSLLAVTLVAALERALRLELPVAALFRLRTVRGLAAFLSGKVAPSEAPPPSGCADSQRGVVMIVDASLPYPDRDSGSRRLFALVGLLRELGFHVIFVPDNDVAAEPYATQLRQLGVDILVTSYLAGGTTRSLHERVEAALPAVDFAWICKPPQFEHYAPLLRRNPRTRILYDSVDLHFVRLHRAAVLAGTADRADAPWRQMRARELAIAAAADVTITVTADEGAVLSEHGCRQIAVVPNVHSPAPAAARGFAARADILFIGSYAHAPNVDAVVWMCDAVMPLVWQQLPQVRVTLLGSNPSALVLGLAQERVIVPGPVHDLAPWFDRHRVFVAPLPYGAGMKGKVGQALEHALPVVSTTIGVEGMNLLHERDVLIADDARGFAAQVVRLYSDGALWQRLASRAHACLAPFSPAAVRATLDALLLRLADDAAEGAKERRDA